MTLIVRRLDANHDVTFGNGLNDYAETGEATGQRVFCDLKVVTGEFFLNTDDGVPWFQPEDSDVQPIMGGTRDLPYTEAVLKARILASDGVATLNAFSIDSFDPRTRALEASANVTSVDGDAINIKIKGP